MYEDQLHLLTADHSSVVVDRRPGSPWIDADRQDAPLQHQGWKIHVSASTRNAHDVLAAVVPVLLRHRCNFKAAADEDFLATLNSGGFGASQVGKFITVYPDSDDVAVEVGADLVAVTRGVSAPAVPSDRRLSPNASVYYRYGAFTGTWQQDRLGQVDNMVRTPEGRYIADARHPVYAQPDWVEDPFRAAGLWTKPPKPSMTIANRYVIAQALTDDRAVTTFLTIDTITGKRTVVKRRRLETGGPLSADVVIARAEREADIMRRCEHLGVFPSVGDVMLADDSCDLPMEHLDGASLSTLIADRFAEHGNFDGAELRRILRSLAEVMTRLHHDGVVYVDLKPDHVFVHEGAVRLIDVESALPADMEPMATFRTPGYASPDQMAEQRPVFADDVYAFGAVIYESLTSYPAHEAPNRHRLLDRPIEAMQPDAPADLVRLARECLDPDPAARPAGFAAIVRRLADAPLDTETVVSAPTATLHLSPAAVMAAVDAMVEEADETDTGALVWLDPDSDGPTRSDLGAGSAGVVLALADFANGWNTDRYDEAIERGAQWLCESTQIGPHQLAGLYVGDAGIGVAIMRGGVQVRNDSLVQSGLDRIRATIELPMQSPDLFNGVAGRLRAHLAAWRVTGADIDLHAARRCADHLLATSTPGSIDGGINWEYPEDHGSMSGKSLLGYAHGLAGIADALLELHDLDPRASTRDMVSRAVVELRGTVTWRNGEAHWPAEAGAESMEPYWCHGATGVATLFTRLRGSGWSHVDDMIDGAVRAAVQHTGAGASQCHGLAGTLELLLDQPEPTVDAQRFAALASAFLVTEPEIAGATPNSFGGWGLLTGRIGVLRAIARFERPECFDSMATLGSLRAPVAASC